MSKPTLCPGFGEYEGKCQNPRGHKGKPPNTIWCQRCDKLRIAHIDRQMDYLLVGFRQFSNAIAARDAAFAAMREALGLAEQALDDLGACDDPRCTEPVCSHALVHVRAVLADPYGQRVLDVLKAAREVVRAYNGSNVFGSSLAELQQTLAALDGSERNGTDS